MAGWSEGERTTVAILLYCTLVKIRSLSHKTAAGEYRVSALLLDNPLGPCSKPEFPADAATHCRAIGYSADLRNWHK